MNRPAVFLGLVLAVTTFVLEGCDVFEHSHQHSDHSHADDHDEHAEHDHDHGDHGGHDDDHGDHHGHGDSDEPSVAVTHFNDITELFVEFPVFSVGNESPFAAHLTWLDNFRPVAAGGVRVILRGGGLPDEEVSVDQPSIPGIFRPVAVPAQRIVAQ